MRAEIGTGFESILSRQSEGAAERQPTSADALHDLALDQVFLRIGADAPRAASAFSIPLGTVQEVEYRQGVFRGLEHAELRAAVGQFLDGMAARARRDSASAGAHYRYERELWHLVAVEGYLETIGTFENALSHAVSTLSETPEGWELLREHVTAYRASAQFAELKKRTESLSRELGELRYNLLLKGARVTIAPVDDEPDLAEAVSAVFERFRRGEVVDHRTAYREATLEHVQGWILERVAQVHPATFGRLLDYARQTADYADDAIEAFADEVRFYLAILDFLAPMRSSGLAVCLPEVSEHDKELRIDDAWDLALAARLCENGQPVIANALALEGPERILVISGPNQGGKTTTARLFGQIHHLASIGCPIPGSSARLPLCDRVLTMFEREEHLDTLEGRLGAEVQRLHDLFELATGRTAIVINEAFASTSLADARILTRDVLERISGLDAIAACVTFIDELSRLNEKTVSMVSAVDPADPAIRTFRVERRPADGRAFARALAEKHGISRAQIERRLRAVAEPMGDAR